MKSKNYYYKNIIKNLTGEDGSQAKSDNYYLKKLYQYFGGTVSDERKKSDNYYLRKTVELVTNTIINSKKPNNYYLKELYLYFGGAATAKRMSDFYYLKQIMVLSENQPVRDISIELTKSGDTTISEYHNDSVILFAKVSSNNTPIADAEVEFFVGDGLIGTSTTNQYGATELSYTSQGKGDITIFAKVNDTTSNEIFIEDCYYFNSGNKSDLVVASGTTVSIKNQTIKVTTSTSGEKKFIFPTNKSFNNSDNAMLELESARADETGNIMGLSIHSSVNGTSSGYAGYWEDHWEAKLYTTTVNVPHSLEKGDIIRFVREDGYTKLYHNDDLIASDNRYVSGFKFGGYTNKDRIQRFKNVKVKKI